VPETSFPFRFRCRRSGNCCARPEGIVRVDAADVARIAAHLGLSESALRARHLAAGGDRLRDAPGGRCTFLVEGRETSCGIYPARPRQCRTWPFWPELLESPEALREARRLCPGIEPLRAATDAAGEERGAPG
jgi:Fe-S-cluster containining protein